MEQAPSARTITRMQTNQPPQIGGYLYANSLGFGWFPTLCRDLRAAAYIPLYRRI